VTQKNAETDPDARSKQPYEYPVADAGLIHKNPAAATKAHTSPSGTAGTPLATAKLISHGSGQRGNLMPIIRSHRVSDICPTPGKTRM